MPIINNAMQGAAQPASQPATAPAAQTGVPPSNPKDIQRRLGVVAMKIIYEKKVSDSLIRQLKAGANNPAQTVATAALGILERMKKDVQGINPDLVFSVSAIVVLFILELAVVSKAFPADKTTLTDSLSALAALTKQGRPAQAAPGQAPGQPAGQSGAMPQLAMMGA